MAKYEEPQINEISRIAKGTEFKGSLISQADIRIDGVFEGDLITSGKLVVGNNASIKGDIMCQSADVSGNVEGKMTVGNTISLKNTAVFSGELKTIKISIELDAVFNGRCDIIDEAEFKSVSAEFFKN